MICPMTDFDRVNFPFLIDGVVPQSTLYGFTFLNLFNLPECQVILLTLMPVVKFKLLNSSNGIINFEKLFFKF